MNKPLRNFLKLSPVVLAASLFAANSVLAEETQQPVTSVAQISEQANNIGQVTSVSQFSDVQPTDWAFQALQSLVERYGCIAGYPNGTYRGNRAMTRYEFAAGLNACLDRINELIATATADLVKKEDLTTLQRLQEEFAAELATLRGRVDALEAKTAELEANQFSTTAKLTGEVVFALSDIFSDERAFPYGLDRDEFAGVDLANVDAVVDRIQELTGFNEAQAAALVESFGAGNFAELDDDIEGNTVFADRVRLDFDASFFGNDRLRVRLQARNVSEFGSSITGTEMTRLAFDGDENNAFLIDDLYYQFNIGEAVRVGIAGTATEFFDLIYTFNPIYFGGGTGTISRYGRFSPIYRPASEGAGATVTFAPNSPISVSLGYLAPNAADSSSDFGVFNGSFAALGQIAFRPSEAFNIGFTYVRSYQNNPDPDDIDVSLFDATGSINANRPFGDFATTSNNYGVQAFFRPAQRFAIAGWAGYSFASAEAGPFEDADAEILYWAASVTLLDAGPKGSTFGVIFGQPPKVTDSDVIEDDDTSYHLEVLYRLQLNDNILITPGVLIIFNPEHNNNNDTIYVGTVRTTFTF